MATQDEQCLETAIEDVTKMLWAKRDVWTAQAPVFENFDIMTELDIGPVTFGAAMCRLKMNRVMKQLGKTSLEDLDDSLLDLACYAILTRAMLKREQGKSKPLQHSHNVSTYVGFELSKE
jgi:hypothetical protein